MQWIQGPYAIPIGLAVASLFLFLLGWLAIHRGYVLGSKGQKLGLKSFWYYLRVISYFLGAVGLLLFSADQFYLVHPSFWGGLAMPGMVLGTLGLIWGMLKGSGKLRRGIQKRRSQRPRRRQDKELNWGLAAVAMFSKVQDQAVFMLTGLPVEGASRKKAQRKLKKEWEAKNAESFREQLQWLWDTGHRGEFHELVEEIASMGEDDFKARVQAVKSGETDLEDPEEIEEEIHRLGMINRQAPQLQQLGFMAWDYLRYIDLCRWGCLAGYLEEAEARENIRNASRILQSRYASWAEMTTAFLLGFEFWSVISWRKEGESWTFARKSLLAEPKGPWKRVTFRPEQNEKSVGD